MLQTSIFFWTKGSSNSTADLIVRIFMYKDIFSLFPCFFLVYFLFLSFGFVFVVGVVLLFLLFHGFYFVFFIYVFFHFFVATFFFFCLFLHIRFCLGFALVVFFILFLLFSNKSLGLVCKIGLFLKCHYV